jgi:hypothetical protein
VSLYPKDFIETVYLAQYREIIYTHRFHYIGFLLVCVGIEFLGKCIGPEQDWHEVGMSKKHFRLAVAELMPKYEPQTDLLYRSLRNGFAHGLLPGREIGLTHRAEADKYHTSHLITHQGSVTLVIEDLYDDFVTACQAVIARIFPIDDKMTRALLIVPTDPAIAHGGLVGHLINAKTTIS